MRSGWSRRGQQALSVGMAALALVSGGVLAGGVAGAASNSSASGSGGQVAPGAPIKTGAISTLTGQLAADFADTVPGVKAYFDWVDAHGGVNGHKLQLTYNLDDGGNPSQFTTLAKDLVYQDKVLAAFTSTYFFTPSIFVQSGTPTYGYNASGNWAGPPNLFAAGGSGQVYSTLGPTVAYVIKKVKAKSVAVISYSPSASKAACSTTANLLKKNGYNVVYTDFAAPVDGNITPDVQRMQRAGADFVFSCMDVTGNISMARAIKQYGLKMTQMWLDGEDQSVVNKYSNLMQKVYFQISNVPTSVPSSYYKYYPGLKSYLSAMKKYEPQYVGSSLAMAGWESGALLAAGVKAAGTNITPQRVVQLTNQITNFTANGLTTVANWAKNGHSNKPTYPNCLAYEQVQGKKLVSVFGEGHEVFVCFAKNSTKNPKPVAAPAGTPGA